jgi:hypothetical protein
MLLSGDRGLGSRGCPRDLMLRSCLYILHRIGGTSMLQLEIGYVKTENRSYRRIKLYFNLAYIHFLNSSLMILYNSLALMFTYFEYKSTVTKSIMPNATLLTHKHFSLYFVKYSPHKQ